MDYKSYYNNAGFYISVVTFTFCIIQIFIFIKCGIKSINTIINKNIPNKMKLLEKIKEQKEKNAMLNNNEPPPKKIRKTIQLNYKEDSKDKKKYKLKTKTFKIENVNNSFKNLNLNDNSNEVLKSKKNNNENIYIKNIFIENNINILNINNEIIKKDEPKEEKTEKIEKKDLNELTYNQALRIDKRNYFQMFLSVIFHEIKIISIFYYKHPYEHLSIILSLYIFELCLDLTLNGLLYTEDVISEKYNNNGSIKFFTTLSLSFISNIISSIISYFLSKLIQYADFLELIIKYIPHESKYFLNISKFKKLLCIKLTFFFLIENLMSLAMCYYLMIFCTVYHSTQRSIMINYLT